MRKGAEKMLSKDTKKKILFDCILVLTLLTVALSAIFIMKSHTDTGDFVRVSVDGRTVAEYPLSRDGEFVLNGGTNILKIEGGRAYMIYGDCHENPSKKCTSQPPISAELEIISCLPNKVLVEVIIKK